MVARQISEHKLVPGTIVVLPIEDVLPDPANENLHPESQIESLRKSLRAWGQQKSVLIDSRAILIKGHGLRLAMLAEGMTEVRCEVSALTGDARSGYRLADNQLARLSFFDEERIRGNLVKLSKHKTISPDILGFGAQSWAELLANGWKKSNPIDLGSIPDYSSDSETVYIKIGDVKQSDELAVMAAIALALEGTGYAAVSEPKKFLPHWSVRKKAKDAKGKQTKDGHAKDTSTKAATKTRKTPARPKKSND